METLTALWLNRKQTGALFVLTPLALVGKDPDVRLLLFSILDDQVLTTTEHVSCSFGDAPT